MALQERILICSPPPGSLQAGCLPLGETFSNTEFISMSAPEATALGGQLKQHDRSYLPIPHLQSDYVMSGEGLWGEVVCNRLSLGQRQRGSCEKESSTQMS